MSPVLVFDTLIEASARAILVAGLVAVALAVFRTKAPALRHAVWTVALATMLALPVMSGWLPTIQIPLRLSSPAVERIAAAIPAVSAVYHSIPPSPTMRSSSDAPISAELSPTPSRPSPMRQSTTVTETSPRQDWRLNAVFVWFVVAIVMLLREAVGWRFAQRLAAQGVPAPIGDGTYESERVQTPVVTGVVQPRVLVPTSWSQWGSGVRRMVLAHERAHVTRRDPLVAALARVNRSIFWFHPLAWWMERHLSRLAERACDEAVVRELKDSRLYAALLVEMAHRLQHQGRRVAWEGIGIVSSRPFEDRLDRILQGPAPDLSRRSKAALAMACGVLMTVAVACGSSSTEVTGGSAAPLAEDPELAKDLAASEARTPEYQAAIAMTLDQVAALEKVVAANPDDLDATRKLLMFYRESGQKVMGWNAMVAARRPHLLRMIARHPESDWTYWPFARRLDPEGYEQARTLWMAHVSRPDVNARVLGRAAAFFDISEKAEAERLLLRAHALDPNGPQPRIAGGIYYAPWLNRLGVVYAKAIVGSDDETVFNVVKSVNRAEAEGPFARHARNELAKTDNSVLLASAGRYLVVNAMSVKLDFDHRALGMSYMEKAASLDRASSVVRTLEWARRSQTHSKDYQRLVEQVGKSLFDLDPTEFDRLSEEMKVAHGHDLLWAPYGDAMRAYQKSDPAAVDKALSEFHRRAEVLDRTARNAGIAPDVAGRLTIDVQLALAAYAMRMGNRAEAVRRLDLAASTAAPLSTAEGNAIGEQGIADYTAIELTYELLTAGERESVAKYYDAIAKTRGEEQRKIYEPAAAAIRAGRMPDGYQRYLARLK